MRQRCVNLDWLEVFVFEPLENPKRDADYYASRGYLVDRRPYGTRVYHEMFTIHDQKTGEPLFEVRRNPKSKVSDNRACHIRLHNRTCYYDDAAAMLQRFLDLNGYTFKRISRIDVCLDFERFDSGDYPAAFLRRYMERKFSKINQANINAHGTDQWSGRIWNSVSWGSPSSDVGTKFYCKTLELYDPVHDTYAKPYIRQAWQAAGLVDDFVRCTKRNANGEVYKPEIWRVEFSIRSNVHRWFVVELDGHINQKVRGKKADHLQSIPNTLDCWDSRAKQLLMFACLQHHYFHFKVYQETIVDGEAMPVRKDRCPDKELFRWDDVPPILYTVGHDSLAGSEKPTAEFLTLLHRIKQYRETTKDDKVKQSCDTIIRELEERRHQQELNSPWYRRNAVAWQQTLNIAMSNPNVNPIEILHEIKQFLQLNDNALPFF